jgi:hypothetical protein
LNCAGTSDPQYDAVLDNQQNSGVIVLAQGLTPTPNCEWGPGNTGTSPDCSGTTSGYQYNPIFTYYNSNNAQVNVDVNGNSGSSNSVYNNMTSGADEINSIKINLYIAGNNFTGLQAKSFGPVTLSMNAASTEEQTAGQDTNFQRIGWDQSSGTIAGYNANQTATFGSMTSITGGTGWLQFQGNLLLAQTPSGSGNIPPVTVTATLDKNGSPDTDGSGASTNQYSYTFGNSSPGSETQTEESIPFSGAFKIPDGANDDSSSDQYSIVVTVTSPDAYRVYADGQSSWNASLINTAS